MIDTVLGNYRLRMEIGRGGMGAVYVADHLHLSRQVALKVLLPELCADPGAVKRLFQEARATSLIQHPGILEIFDCAAPRQDLAFIVMELLAGESLASYLSRLGPLPPCPPAIDLARQIAAALGAAHAQRIFHRDLKPDNVFLLGAASPQRIKLLDFGIAKLTMDTGNTSRTRTGALMGTPLYMSPEQCRGSGTVDHRTDIYSFGCLLFEIWCGRVPFNYEGAGSILMAHMSEPPADPRAFAPHLPARLAALTLACLEKDPGRRPQSMAEVEAELHQCAVGMPKATLPALNTRDFTAEVPWQGRTGIDEPDARKTDDVAVAVVGGTRVLPAPLSQPRVSAPTNTTFQHGAAEMVGSAGPGARRSRARSAWVAIAASLVVAGGGVFAYRAYLGPSDEGSAARPSHAAAGSARTADTEPRAPVSATITVDIEGGPAGLVVKVDGVRREPPVELPKSDTTHLFDLAAPGFLPQRLRFDAARSRVVTLAMQPEPKPKDEGRPDVAGGRTNVAARTAAAPVTTTEKKKPKKRDRASAGDPAPQRPAAESFHRFDDI